MRGILVLLAGVLMMLSSVAHALLGWPAMRSDLQKAGAGPDLTAGLAAGWYFGSVAMLTFGVITLICGLRLRRGDSSGALPVQVIGAGYVLFGLVAGLARNFNPHFLAFIVIGLLAGLPALGVRRQ
jgi:hypothetical protein